MVPRCAAIPALAAALLAACSSDSTSSALSLDRIEALVRIGESGTVADVPSVLPSLASDDPLVRWTAQQTLQRVAGTTNGYEWSADRASRERAIGAWHAWCEQRGITGGVRGASHA